MTVCGDAPRKQLFPIARDNGQRDIRNSLGGERGRPLKVVESDVANQ
jgi:hypothetical protein